MTTSRIASLVVISGMLLSASAFAQEDQQIKIFSLQNANAAEMASVIRPLFPNPQVVTTVDPRTNSMIVRGQADMLAEMEAVLLRLDQMKAASSSGENESTSSSNNDSPRDGIVVVNPLPHSAIIQSLVKEGTKVTLGQKLAELESVNRTEELGNLTIEIETLKAAASSIDDFGSNEMAITETKAALQLAEMKLTHGKLALKSHAQRLEVTLRAHVERLQDVEQYLAVLGRRRDQDNASNLDRDLLDARVMLRETRMQIDGLQAELDLFRKSEAPLRIAEMETDVVLTRARLVEAQNASDRDLREREAEAAAIRTQMKVLQQRYKKLNDETSARSLLAPIAGELRYLDAGFKEGSQLRAGQSVFMIIPDPSSHQ